jgi:drug/metabolite transporter (DMT)-like permease
VTTGATRGTLLVAAAAVCWSSGGLIARLVATDPWTTNVWRCAFGAAFLMVAVRLTERRGVLAQWRRMGWPGLAVAVCLAIASTCFILALARTSVANTLILMSVGPYVAGLLGWLLLGERVGLRTWLTMAVALAGAVVMVSGSRATGALAGDLLAIAMAAAFATATVLMRRHGDIRMGAAAALAMVLVCLVALPLSAPLAAAPRDVGLLALFGVGQFGVGFLLFTRGARLIPAARSALVGMLETVLGPLWVWLVLAEQPGPATLIGGALILGALVTHTLLEVPRRRAVPHRAQTSDPSPGDPSPARSPADARPRRAPQRAV